jgi:hypothetical protein
MCIFALSITLNPIVGIIGLTLGDGVVPIAFFNIISLWLTILTNMMNPDFTWNAF